MEPTAQKDLICRLLKAWRESAQLYNRLEKHLQKVEIDLSIFKLDPLSEAAYNIIFDVIDDEDLIAWWLYHKENSDAFQVIGTFEIVTIKTAEELWDYHFKNKGAEEAQN